MLHKNVECYSVLTDLVTSSSGSAWVTGLFLGIGCSALSTPTRTVKGCCVFQHFGRRAAKGPFIVVSRLLVLK